MSKSLKQLVDENSKQLQDSIHRIHLASHYRTTEVREAAIKKAADEAENDLHSTIAARIIAATTAQDPSILQHLFGEMAYKDYCSKEQLDQLGEELAQNNDLFSTYSYKLYNSIFLVVGFYYACYQGVLPLVCYYVEQQPFSEDMGNVLINTQGFEKYFPNTPVLHAPPLKLATISNQLSCVEYLYDNTDAMVEGECEDFADRRSNLQIATTNNNAPLVSFLLSHAADPNAPSTKFSMSVFDLAVKTLDMAIINAYLDAGALVTRKQIHAAIGMLAPQPILQLLLARCINKEDLYHPYLLKAVKTGNIDYLTAIESLLPVSSWSTIAAYDPDSLPAGLIDAATSSGNLAMVKHIGQQHQLDIKAIVQANTAEFDASVQSGRLKNKRDINVMHRVGETLIGKASCDMTLLQFYYETFDITLSDKALKLLCAHSYNNLRVNSYFLGHMQMHAAKKDELRQIALDFDTLPLITLCRLFNTPLVLSGNPYSRQSGCHENYTALIAERIHDATKDWSVAAIYHHVHQDPEALIGALFYFCSKRWADSVQPLIDFFRLVRAEHAMLIDTQNSLGTTLAHFAYDQQHHDAVDFLTSRGANPDKPNHAGQTLLAQRISGFYYERHGEEKALAFIKEHMQNQHIGHTLRYQLGQQHLFHAESVALLLKATNGTIAPVSVDNLITTILTSHKDTHARQECFTTLFINLADLPASRLVQRLRHPDIIEGVAAEAFAEECQGYLKQFEGVTELSDWVKNKRLVEQPKQSAATVAFLAPRQDSRENNDLCTQVGLNSNQI